jgi:hypothetical protein
VVPLSSTTRERYAGTLAVTVRVDAKRARLR